MNDDRSDVSRRRLLCAATGIAATGVAVPAVAAPDITYAPDPAFQGQRFYVFGGGITDGTTYQLRRATRVSGGSVAESRFVEEVTADAETDVPPDRGGGTGAAIGIDSGALEAGRYFVAGGDLPARPDVAGTVEVVGVAGPPTATLELTPETPTVSAGGTTTVELVVAGASAGVGGYALELDVVDPAVARITDIEHTGDLSERDDELRGEGASARIDADLREAPHGAGDVTVAVVTLAGEAPGETEISIVEGPTIRGADRNRYDLTDLGRTITTVFPTPTATVAVDPGTAETTAGDEITLDVVIEEPTAAIREYGLTVAVDSAIARFVDAEGTAHEAAESPTASIESGAGGEVTLSAVFEEPHPEETLSAGRVVVAAVDAGETTATVEGAVTAGDGAPYDLTSASGTISVESGEPIDAEAGGEPPTEDPDSEPAPDPEPVDQPGFGLGGTAAGVGTAWYLWWQRNGD